MSTINNTIKTILLITSLLLLNACSDDDSIVTAFTNSKSIDAPYVMNNIFTCRLHVKMKREVK